ncbi:hypothetical protein HanXRQr2_Chr10g0456291 [Helianthus annuus]|uniref:Uncharacterized protein n=1 Tax=Helianthus annuus TaxID=4232 RepID=A0A9K3HZB9_HELAN|nr:hypothetical protein HanXRQr2_Chr10g0456291 [Helianthus annuus]
MVLKSKLWLEKQWSKSEPLDLNLFSQNKQSNCRSSSSPSSPSAVQSSQFCSSSSSSTSSSSSMSCMLFNSSSLSSIAVSRFL